MHTFCMCARTCAPERKSEKLNITACKITSTTTYKYCTVRTVRVTPSRETVNPTETVIDIEETETGNPSKGEARVSVCMDCEACM